MSIILSRANYSSLIEISTYDIVLRVQNTQARDITVLQRYSNVESIYSSVITIFVLAIALLLKKDLNYYVGTEIFQGT